MEDAKHNIATVGTWVVETLDKQRRKTDLDKTVNKQKRPLWTVRVKSLVGMSSTVHIRRRRETIRQESFSLTLPISTR